MVRPLHVHRYFPPSWISLIRFSLRITCRVPKFRIRAKTRVAPSEHRIPRGQYTVLRHARPGKERRPRFRYRLTCFRCVIDGSLALASLIHTCRSSSPAFDRNVHHRTLSNEAVYGGLKPVTADRLRRAFLCPLPAMSAELCFSVRVGCGDGKTKRHQANTIPARVD